MDSKKARILLVEDDVNLSFVVKDNLEMKGYEVHLRDDGEQGLEAFNDFKFDLCILDVMLPKMDGYGISQRIRKIDHDVPIIFLTAKSTKEDRLDGFKHGGDDYITKPFSIEELVYRIEVFLSRSRKSNSAVNKEETYSLNKYIFDYPSLSLAIDGEEKKLTQKEADLLKVLILNSDRVVKREELLELIWGNNDYFSGRSMDVFISKLRKYLREDDAVEIVNYHGIGFKLNVKN